MLNLAQTLMALVGHQVKPYGAPQNYISISTDSRSIKPGELFVALRGDNFDGHAFVRDVLKAGAVAALVDHDWVAANPALIRGLALIAVDDTRAAFGSLARAWRATFDIPLVGVVGSNGKTTVKEMISSILAAAHGFEHRLATTGNLNNDIGVPTMLLRLRTEHHAAVIEMGMNHPGETNVLAGLAQPTVALINNAQREHQEFMKTVAAVAEEHAAVMMALPPDGVAILNADDAFFEFWRVAAGTRRVLSFGFSPKADVRCVVSGKQLRLITPAGEAELRLATVGDHNIRNALGAAAAGLAAGCSLADVVRGLALFAPVKGRLQIHAGQAGSTVIDDTYNANPDSVRAAIDVLAGIAGRRILVLGDMGEVGDHAPEYHHEIGGYARQQGVDVLLTLGEASTECVRGFGSGSEHFDSLEKLLAVLKPMLDASTTVLVKGSRFMRMERVVEAIKSVSAAA